MDRRVSTSISVEQTTPSASWSIEHNLCGYPIVEVFVVFDGEYHKTIPLAITYVDDNNCLVQFSSPQVGKVTVA